MKGKCINLDGCSKFDENGKIIQDIPDGEDFVCQECGRTLREITDGESDFPWKKVIIIAAAVLAVAGIVLFFVFSGGNGVTAIERIIVE